MEEQKLSSLCVCVWHCNCKFHLTYVRKQVVTFHGINMLLVFCKKTIYNRFIFENNIKNDDKKREKKKLDCSSVALILASNRITIFRIAIGTI